MKKKHDHSYKLLFSHPRMVADLLKGFVKESWVERVDFSTLERCNGSYVSDDLREREDDMVWRMKYGKEWVYLYLLLEFQSTVDKFMAVRIMGYKALLYQDLIKKGHVKKSGKLPVILPLVLYNGIRSWKAPLHLQDLVEPVEGELSRFRHSMEYILLEERAIPKKELKPGPNMVSLLFALEQSRGEDEIVKVLDRFWHWLEPKELDDIKRAFAAWISRVAFHSRTMTKEKAAVNLLEVRTMLAERLKIREKRLVKKTLAQGLEQGLEQGRIQQQQVAVIANLEAKFRRVPAGLVKKIEECDDLDALLKLQTLAITSKSIEAFRKKLL